MVYQTLSAGFGGQGVLFLGDLLTRSALHEGLQTTYMPTYGVAMRGGTANCVVTMSDEEIGSPLLDRPQAAIILNQPSFDKFVPIVEDGGLVIANSSMVDSAAYKGDGGVKVVFVPATETAREIAGTDRSTNMVAVGAFLACQDILSYDAIEATLSQFTDGAKGKLLPKNLAAIRKGMELAQG